MSLTINVPVYGSYVIIDPYDSCFVAGQEYTITIHRDTAAHKSYTISYSFPQDFYGSYTPVAIGDIVRDGQEEDTVLKWTAPDVLYNDTELSTKGVSNKFYFAVNFTGHTWQQNTGNINTYTIKTPPPAMSCSVADVNGAAVALTGNSSVLIRGVSTARAAIQATARPKSTLTKVTINGEPVGAIDNRDHPRVGVEAFTFYAEDSRKLSVSQTVRPTVIPYIQLTASGTAVRPSPTGDTVNVALSGNYWTGSFGLVTNTLAVRWSCTNGAGGDVAVTSIGDGRWTGAVTLSADYRSSYTLTVTATDQVGTVTAAVPINRGVPVFDWGKNSFRVNVPILGPGSDSAPPQLGTMTVGSAGLPVFLSGGIPTPVEPATTRSVLGAASAWEVLWQNGNLAAANFPEQTLSLPRLAYCNAVYVQIRYFGNLTPSDSNQTSGALCYFGDAEPYASVVFPLTAFVLSGDIRCAGRYITVDRNNNTIRFHNGARVAASTQSSPQYAVPVAIIGVRI